MPYDKSKPYSCPCCGYWNGDMKHDYYKHKKPKLNGEVGEIVRHWAILHGYNCVRVGFDERATQTIFWVESPDTRKHIEFLGAYVADDFDAGVYSIEELCGDDKEYVEVTTREYDHAEAISRATENLCGEEEE